MTHAEARLLALPRFADAGAAAYRPGLERMRALLADMGDPHAATPAVHVAGTNGKGSTASFAASVAHAAGAHVGLHTSPHLVSLRERMRVDGRPAPPEWLEGAVERWGGAVEALEPSFFEATVALSLLYFAEQGVDLAVVEVGLGGRLDATNVLAPLVSVVTHVGLDHTDLLGETVGEIAREKAGIAKPGVPFLHAVADAGARAALEAEARGRGGGGRGRPRDVPDRDRDDDPAPRPPRDAVGGLRRGRGRAVGRAPRVERGARRARGRGGPARPARRRGRPHGARGGRPAERPPRAGRAVGGGRPRAPRRGPQRRRMAGGARGRRRPGGRAAVGPRRRPRRQGRRRPRGAPDRPPRPPCSPPGWRVPGRSRPPTSLRASARAGRPPSRSGPSPTA